MCYTGFNFGKRHTKEQVMDLNIPEWCRHDARLFVLILRQALENPHVSSNLHNWINLIYGYQQQGQAATEAVNKFHPAVSSQLIRIYVLVSSTLSHLFPVLITVGTFCFCILCQSVCVVNLSVNALPNA